MFRLWICNTDQQKAALFESDICVSSASSLHYWQWAFFLYVQFFFIEITLKWRNINNLYIMDK